MGNQAAESGVSMHPHPAAFILFTLLDGIRKKGIT
jgi:hypothetical protein